MKNLSPDPENQTSQEIKTSNHLDKAIGTNPKPQEKSMKRNQKAYLCLGSGNPRLSKDLLTLKKSQPFTIWIKRRGGVPSHKRKGYQKKRKPFYPLTSTPDLREPGRAKRRKHRRSHDQQPFGRSNGNKSRIKGKNNA
jgi:hypothetical protein